MAPTLEEIDDVEEIDDLDFDPAEFDPRNPFSVDMPVEGAGAHLRPTAGPSSSASPPATSSSTSPRPAQPPQMPQMPQMARPDSDTITDERDLEQFKHWQVLYPVYFDKNKSHHEGRRVSKSMAVENPLAYNIMVACKTLGIHCILEASKTHPKDWANPGRVRVLTHGDEAAGYVAPRIAVNNKRHLYKIIAEYLQKNPTTERMPFNPQIVNAMQQAGLGVPQKAEPPARPQGWQINSVLPLNSRAVSGGEQNEDMMKQMQSQMFPGMQSLPDGNQKPKKVKVRANR